MWTSQQSNAAGVIRFFSVALSHESLVNYYSVNYQLIQTHKYSLNELEDMIPWEREIYLAMLMDEVKAKHDAAKEQQFSNSR